MNELVNPEMEIISITQMKKVVQHIVIDENEPVMIEGASGIGKTVGIEQKCEEIGAFYCPILTSQYDTVDFKGTPWSRAIDAAEAAFGDDEDDVAGLDAMTLRSTMPKKQFTVWSPASTLPVIGNPLFPADRPIILFFDEITSATIPVMAILYQLIDKRRVGEHVLMDNVRIICAGNRAEDRGVVNRMPLPLCNRMTWFGVTMDLAGWTEYMTSKYGEPAAPVIAYFNWMKAELHNYDPAKPKRVFCSPRTAEKATKYFLNARMPEDIKLAAMAGVIGADVAAKLWGYHTIWQGVQKLMDDIKKNPETAAIPEGNNVMWAVALSISGILTATNASRYYEYLKRMDGEYCIAAWQMAVAREQRAVKEKKMRRDAPKLYESDSFMDMARRYKAIFSRN